MRAYLVSDSVGKTVSRPIYSYRVKGLLLLAEGTKVTYEVVNKLKEHGVHAVFVDTTCNTLLTSKDILEALNPICFGIIGKPVIDKFCSVLLHRKDVLELLYKIYAYDYATFSHSVSTGALLYGYYDSEGVVGNRMGITGCLHDIGKIFIPIEILNKPKKLSPQEFSIIKLHTSVGYTLLLGEEVKKDIDMRAVLLHHERANGTGYPHGKCVGEKDFSSVALQVVDVFDALTSNRTYRVASSKSGAISTIKECVGSDFDAGVSIKVLEYLMKGGDTECIMQKTRVI